MSTRLTLPIQNYLRKQTVQLHPPIVLCIIIMRTLVDRIGKILRHRSWSQKPGITLVLLLIMLTFLTMVEQRRGPKMGPHRPNLIVFNTITTPTGSVPNAHNGHAPPYSGYAAVVLSTESANEKSRLATYK